MSSLVLSIKSDHHSRATVICCLKIQNCVLNRIKWIRAHTIMLELSWRVQMLSLCSISLKSSSSGCSWTVLSNTTSVSESELD